MFRDMKKERQNLMIKDIVEFIQWAEHFENGEYLFRGVQRACYPIEASAYRRLSENQKTPEGLLEVNQDLITETRHQGHDLKNGQKLHDLELLAELQHFGAATGLIDFTYNALVALWFACWKSPSQKNKNGKVVVLRRDGLDPLIKVDYHLSQKNIAFFFRPDEAGRYPLYQWQPKPQNYRIVAQQSVFVFGGAPIQIAAECEIKAACQETILAQLAEISGITDTSLFPDFQGLAWLRAHDKPFITRSDKHHRLRGLDALQEKQWDQAIKSFNEAITAHEKENLEAASDRTLIECYYHRARAYWYKASSKEDLENAIKDTTLVIESYEKVKDSYPDRADELNRKLTLSFNMLGLAYGHQKISDFEKAIENYNKAIELDGDFIKAYNNRGIAYADKKDFDKAIENYDKAIELQPHYAPACCNRGEAWLHKQEWNKARKDLTKARELNVDIITSFRVDYENVEDFEEKNCIQDMPTDLREMLTPQTENLSVPR